MWYNQKIPWYFVTRQTTRFSKFEVHVHVITMQKNSQAISYDG